MALHLQPCSCGNLSALRLRITLFVVSLCSDWAVAEGRPSMAETVVSTTIAPQYRAMTGATKHASADVRSYFAYKQRTCGLRGRDAVVWAIVLQPA